MSLIYPALDAPSETTETVKTLLADGKSCFVQGLKGSGKTYSVRKAQPDAVWIQLDSGPLQAARFLVDLAGQTNAGSKPLETLLKRGLIAAWESASEVLGNRVLVVDRAESLRSREGWVWHDPASALWNEGRHEIADCVWTWARSHRVVLIGRSEPRPLEGSPFTPVPHSPPGELLALLKKSHPESYLWAEAVQLIGNHPLGLTMARALLALVGASDFNALVIELLAEKLDPGASVSRIVRTLAERLPASWRRVLYLVHTLDGITVDAMTDALNNPDDPRSEDNLGALDSLEQIQLLRRQEDRFRLTFPADELKWDTASCPSDLKPLLTASARRLTKMVNSAASLQPEDAQRILLAHRLFVAVGDFRNAERYATLHVAGLLELAARTSRDEHFEDAFQQYDSILKLIQDGRHTSRHVRSYVIHYRAFNGHRARCLNDELIRQDLERAVELWSENALWQQRLLIHLVRTGRLTDARTRIPTAYEQVAAHPFRDSYLRVVPARIAMKEGVPLFALELLQPIESRSQFDLYGQNCIDQIWKLWMDGVELGELPTSQGTLYLKRSGTLVHRVQLSRLAQADKPWLARLSSLGVVERGEGPRAALLALGDKLAQETVTLIRQPSHALPDDRYQRKSLLIGVIDLLNSDIGLEHDSERWFLGKLEGLEFVPVQLDHPRIPISGELVGTLGSVEGLFFARVRVARDGQPSGVVEHIVQAGSGRSLRELFARLEALKHQEDQ